MSAPLFVLFVCSHHLHLPPAAITAVSDLSAFCAKRRQSRGPVVLEKERKKKAQKKKEKTRKPHKNAQKHVRTCGCMHLPCEVKTLCDLGPGACCPRAPMPGHVAKSLLSRFYCRRSLFVVHCSSLVARFVAAVRRLYSVLRRAGTPSSFSCMITPALLLLAPNTNKQQLQLCSSPTHTHHTHLAYHALPTLFPLFPALLTLFPPSSSLSSFVQPGS